MIMRLVGLINLFLCWMGICCGRLLMILFVVLI